MKKIVSVLLVLLPLIGKAQQPEIVKFSFVESLLKNTSDTTYVINFWATWCAPCVKEIPEFEKLNKEYTDKKVKVILVSLDFKRQFADRLIPFAKDHQLKSQVVLLDEPDYNKWIDNVDKNWGGAIPATLMLNNSKKRHTFYEKEFTYSELKESIQTFIN